MTTHYLVEAGPDQWAVSSFRPSSLEVFHAGPKEECEALLLRLQEVINNHERAMMSVFKDCNAGHICKQ